MKNSQVLLLGLIILSSCKSSDPAPVPVDKTEFTVESIIGTNTGNIVASRKGFFSLSDGKVYSQTEAVAVSDQIDFAYNYHGGGCSSCRFFENVKQMSTRTGYVSAFSTVTDSRVENVEYYNKMSVAAFDSVETVADFERVVKNYKIKFDEMYGSADVTNRTTDAATGKVFGFKDKKGRLGFFKISNYTANVATGSATPLTISVKLKPL
ncbi:hypothetical protein [Emticicia agri]|uniref:Uncharacterized protein n=1 Tax=Emticicia agri TaxID=2492393 RepID=A0A4Q5M4T2_9BACT|nr:hypothetical protein [Emticicia agri]RYU96913.1 hypothetical protein EWM59_05130 [Emticicia agri]